MIWYKLEINVNKWDRGSCLSLIPSSLEYINGTRLVKFGLFVDITPSI